VFVESKQLTGNVTGSYSKVGYDSIGHMLLVEGRAVVFAPRLHLVEVEVSTLGLCISVKGL
jgi:hypothetical protein